VIRCGCDQLFQLHDPGRELANSFSRLIDRHGIFIELEAEAFLVEIDFLGIRRLRDLARTRRLMAR
jgi:hypothetical protein